MDVIGEGRADGLDLSPRETPPPRRSRGRRGWLPVAVIVLVLVAAGFVVSKALTSASLFFYNANEAVAKRPALGTSRFRIQGTVEDDVRRTATGADFSITFDGAVVAVHHVGDAPELFKPGEPVVLEGHWAKGSPVFDSDNMLVKHDANYVAKHPGRIDTAVEGGKVPPKVASTTTTSSPSP
jgi:cytochrome c-type biogenesis protein CcmE